VSGVTVLVGTKYIYAISCPVNEQGPEKRKRDTTPTCPGGSTRDAHIEPLEKKKNVVGAVAPREPLLPTEGKGTLRNIAAKGIGTASPQTPHKTKGGVYGVETGIGQLGVCISFLI